MSNRFGKNGEDKFEICKTIGATEAEDVYVTIKAGITSSEISLNEEVDQTAYMDGDGYKSTDVTGAQVTIAFSGHRVYGDAAQDYIYGKALTIGDARKTKAKITYSDGLVLTGPCTLANIEGPSGDAGTKQDIGFEVHLNGKPTSTPAAG